MSRRGITREASGLVFLDLMLGDDSSERDERRKRWERRKGGARMK